LSVVIFVWRIRGFVIHFLNKFRRVPVQGLLSGRSHPDENCAEASFESFTAHLTVHSKMNISIYRSCESEGRCDFNYSYEIKPSLLLGISAEEVFLVGCKLGCFRLTTIAETSFCVCFTSCKSCGFMVMRL
jgi:hypothetical protein